jgi:hypothetical protein
MPLLSPASFACNLVPSGAGYLDLNVSIDLELSLLTYRMHGTFPAIMGTRLSRTQPAGLPTTAGPHGRQLLQGRLYQRIKALRLETSGVEKRGGRWPALCAPMGGDHWVRIQVVLHEVVERHAEKLAVDRPNRTTRVCERLNTWEGEYRWAGPLIADPCSSRNIALLFGPKKRAVG